MLTTLAVFTLLQKMGFFDLLRDNAMLLMLCTGALGLVIGSFLNVVVHRLPILMERAWLRESREILELAPVETPAYSLALPRSHCPTCQKPLRLWHNIPLLSWIALRGRCAYCHTPIGLRYPLIEILAACIGIISVWRFGWSLQLLPACIFGWFLLCLSAIDARTQLLPDSIVYPFLWLGLLLSLIPIFTRPESAIIGAAAGYLSLWSLYHLFRLVTGKEGMGYGDFKLFAAIGAWLGWSALPAVAFLASISGSIAAIGMMMGRRWKIGTRIPFGPWLALAAWLYLLFSTSIQSFIFPFLSPGSIAL
jgi:leader peptidase (prepilin peptidase) / N-methyltransferase